MLTLILLGGLGGYVLWRHHKKGQTTPTTQNPQAAQVTQAALAQPPSAPGQLTPARAAIHGELMQRCHDPQKLRQAAALFGHEGLPYHSDALLRKAAMVHEMAHGAQEIVERSRAGDQHAMAMAKSIGEQARAGSPRARLSWVLIEDYTKRHPPKEPSSEPLP